MVLEILGCRVKKSYLVTFLAVLWIESISGGDVHMHQLSVHPAHCMHSSASLTSLVMVELHGVPISMMIESDDDTSFHNIFLGRLI